jgi:hypothetical protein
VTRLSATLRGWQRSVLESLVAGSHGRRQ